MQRCAVVLTSSIPHVPEDASMHRNWRDLVKQ